MIHIEIWQVEGGGIQCRSWLEDKDLTSADVLTLVGMLESTKMSFMHGRWGLMDAKEGSKRGLGFPPVDLKKTRKRARMGKRDE